MLAVALNGLCLQYASVELRSDRQVVLQAIRSNPYAFLGYQNIYKRLVLTKWSNCMESAGKLYLGVSKNRATPKWMVYNGKPY